MTKGSGTDANPRDGDRIRFEVRIDGGVVAVASFDVRGCAVAHDVAAALARLMSGQGVDAPWTVDVHGLRREVRGIDEEHERCALTAIGALRAAVIDAQVSDVAAGIMERRS